MAPLASEWRERRPTDDEEPLDDLVRAWLADLACSGRAANTIRGYTSGIRAVIAHCKRRGVTNWARVTADLVHEHLAELRALGRSQSCIASRVSILRNLFDWGMGRGFNLPKLHIHCRAVSRGIPRHIEEPEFQRMFHAIRPDDFFGLRDRAILALLWYSGITSSELAALDLENLHLAERLLIIPASSRPGRAIPLAHQAADALRPWLLTRRPVPGSDALFTAANGLRLQAKTVNLMVTTRSAQVGMVPTVTPRVLRSSFAVRLLSAGIELHYVGALMGQQSIETTKEYQRALSPHAKLVETARRALEGRTQASPRV